jgi:hypothetical protein
VICRARFNLFVVLVRDLRQKARAWRVAEGIREFLRAIEIAVPTADRGDRSAAWLKWAKAYAEQLDPIANRAEFPKPPEPD